MPDADVPSDIEIIKQRKKDGIDIPLQKDVQARTTSTYLEYVKLVHNALPELDYDDIDLSTRFLGHRFSAPLIIDSMTGGTDEATVINGRLGELAEKYGLGMGLGSQRAGLKSEELASTYSVARKNAPNAFLIANIGGAQLAKGLSVDDARKIVKMIRANALVVHLNPLQELVQPEGEPRYKGVHAKIVELVKSMDVPVIVKEVGAGISREVAIKLEMAGASAINVAGAGGTSWAGVEKLRADMVKDRKKARLGEMFWDWGMPTAASLIETRKAVKLPLVASGGLRNGLEVAKCIALGASMAAMAYPFLKAAAQSREALFEFADSVLAELRSTMFLVGAANVRALASSRYILTGALAQEVSRA
ncbi:type 2 isopentenyl-diphosphate Delta-isomerase [Nitrososphaera viennensis]|uniref:Isopentenyl-diphosphate delta-isomerase n=2 Tax=Nitrososphaera viennensis TaxID=1034015 RepID=A0A060HHI3_9ARCH|nr:type 2 isopentenyl-diphosphate Delta-isomerase [Nitrososphaera viennensis]AIC15023.1 isopentenyl-diphosphate delta-isomerase [Nitrososphaera viennensis EN76]UVS69954.1 type 2 isopentenyl-diphosphate Delta-isomerase [Nitrososphaera viennensis]